MSDYIGITEELAACFAARTPLVILETEERDRAQSALSDVARSANLEIDFYTDCNQFVELRRGERKTDVGREPLAFIEETLKKKSGCIFALGDVRFLDGDNASCHGACAARRAQKEHYSDSYRRSRLDGAWQARNVSQIELADASGTRKAA